MGYLKSLRFNGMFAAGGWAGYGLYIAITKEPVSPWTAALLAFLLSFQVWSDARKR